MHTQEVITLPVAAHIIHNNGPENISDARVIHAIQHLNDAFAGTDNYTGNDVNTQIQFCMAKHYPAGKATHSITRDVSTYTSMGGTEYYSDDLHIKNINRWNTGCYINIWLVNSIPGDVVGYAYLPSATGTNIDPGQVIIFSGLLPYSMKFTVSFVRVLFFVRDDNRRAVPLHRPFVL